MVLLRGNVTELLFSKENEIISIILTHLRLLSNTDKKKMVLEKREKYSA